jgi:hypothetical protein
MHGLGMGAAGMAACLLWACFGTDSNPGGAAAFTGKSWSLREVSFDLGREQGGKVVFGMGETLVLGGDTMKVRVDSLPAEADSLFPKGRACFSGAAWESPGDCRLDDAWTFAPDGSLSVAAGATRCADEPQTRSGAWSMDSEETELTVTLEGETAAFRIENMEAGLLALSETGADSAACGFTVHVKTLYRFAAR